MHGDQIWQAWLLQFWRFCSFLFAFKNGLISLSDWLKGPAWCTGCLGNRVSVTMYNYGSNRICIFWGCLFVIVCLFLYTLYVLSECLPVPLCQCSIIYVYVIHVYVCVSLSGIILYYFTEMILRQDLCDLILITRIMSLNEYYQL